jgi:murein DD-endopeptidase MepM/ murein hydrolase activator NlpD
LAQRGPGYYDGPRGTGLSDEAGRGYPPQQPNQSGRGQPSTTSTELAPIPDRTPRERTAMGTPTERAPVAERRYETPRAAAGGETIEVQPGDTLFGIAKRHGVQVGTLIEVNGLQNGTSIKPGQRLTLPVGATPARAAPETRAPIASRTTQPMQTGAIDTSRWGGRHTLSQGESLYAVARQYGVPLAELQRVNGITEPTRVRAGTVLFVPGNAEPAPAVAERIPAATPRASLGAPGTAGQPRMLNTPGEKTASLGDRSSDASAPTAEAATGRFRWPARGRVIAAFGKRPDGTHNDGVNIAVPQGTEIHAAESGRVAYAGNELKGYGNLVLIRHDNGWVSAYAHADQVLVKRDDVVRRGQVIAKAGKTGTVDQPQLHFELRQGSKPVDPMLHLEKN